MGGGVGGWGGPGFCSACCFLISSGVRGTILAGSFTAMGGAAPNWNRLRCAGPTSTACTLASRSSRNLGSTALGSTSLVLKEGRNSDVARREAAVPDVPSWVLTNGRGTASGSGGSETSVRAADDCVGNKLVYNK